MQCGPRDLLKDVYAGLLHDVVGESVTGMSTARRRIKAVKGFCHDAAPANEWGIRPARRSIGE